MPDRPQFGVWHALTVNIEGDDQDLARLAEKLAPGRIRRVLGFAALLQMTHEMIKSSVLDGVAGFYGHVRSGDVWMWGKDQYTAEVLSNAPKKPFDASLIWLVGRGALTQEQSDRLAAIYTHRHDLTHGLAKYVVYLDYEPDDAILLDALGILRDLSIFWTKIDMELGTFEDYPGLDVEDIAPLGIVVLELSIAAVFEGSLPEWPTAHPMD